MNKALGIGHIHGMHSSTSILPHGERICISNCRIYRNTCRARTWVSMMIASSHQRDIFPSLWKDEGENRPGLVSLMYYLRFNLIWMSCSPVEDTYTLEAWSPTCLVGYSYWIACVLDMVTTLLQFNLVFPVKVNLQCGTTETCQAWHSTPPVYWLTISQALISSSPWTFCPRQPSQSFQEEHTCGRFQIGPTQNQAIFVSEETRTIISVQHTEYPHQLVLHFALCRQESWLQRPVFSLNPWHARMWDTTHPHGLWGGKKNCIVSGRKLHWDMVQWLISSINYYLHGGWASIIQNLSI